MFCETFCAAIQGIDGCMIQVEADVSDGLPCFSMVGFLASEVKEAKERVSIAIRNSGFRIPPKKITINLSPADFRKAGTGYDLAIAAAILGALGYFPQEYLEGGMLLGELSLDGTIQPINGVLPMVYTALEHGCNYCIVPADNIKEAQIVEGIRVVGVHLLSEVIDFLQNAPDIHVDTERVEFIGNLREDLPDFRDICGQAAVKRAVEVAVAGRHNILMVGPPGSGKTMIARRIPGIMPPLSFEEQMEISQIYSVSGLLDEKHPLVMERPFRSPHHTIPQTALVGGGRYPKPGECSLSSGGVLFLDELPEFQRQSVEVLRQPLEEGFVTISRLEGSYRYPAKCQLVAAANPCLCGFYPDRRKCNCTTAQIRKYFGRISRPILDRIDICTETVSLNYDELENRGEEESSAQIRERVMEAQKIQTKRYEGESFRYNGELTAQGVKRYCVLSADAEAYLRGIFDQKSLTARGYHKILKVARSIADLDHSQEIKRHHLSEAVCYRSFPQDNTDVNV